MKVFISGSTLGSGLPSQLR